jgi:hypothetical protein
MSDRDTAVAVLACQRVEYVVEAKLMSFDGIPPLYETLDEQVQCGERFLGSYDQEGLAGVVSWKKLPDETVDIYRLVVAPRAFRRGHATVLLDALSSLSPLGALPCLPGPRTSRRWHSIAVMGLFPSDA